MIKTITHDHKTMAIIIPQNFHTSGIKFVTPDDFSQQLAYMNHPQGHIILPHKHNKVQREVLFTQEVLILRTGKIRVDFYDDDQNYLQSAVLNAGDVILLAAGGHGFEVLEDAEFIEVKQGPYAGDNDKVRFAPAAEHQIHIEE